jgi:hypothetical protein
MRGSTLVGLTLLAASFGCGARQGTIGSSVGQGENPVAPGDDSATAGEPKPSETNAAAPNAAVEPGDRSGSPAQEPPPDPALVKALIEKTGETAATDNELHVRLEVTPQPAGQRWLVAVVNRGTEPAKVQFDLRRLKLRLEQPEDPKKPRPKWQKKPAPRSCKLPEGFAGPALSAEDALTIEPGEGLVQTFDPRLYCISPAGDSMLAQGQTVTVELGFTPKPPRQVWQHGKRVELPSPQVAPFIVEPATLDREHDKRIKQLVANPFEVTADMTAGETEEDTSLPLQLRLVRGSDAATERTATATVEVRARGQKSMLYFRRELVSFTVHGPDGIRGCDPQPDDRAPDRQAYTTLNAGGAVSATGLLTELCPSLTFGRPGLYLVSARLDADRDGSEFGLRAFTGRLESRRQALVRISAGDLPALPPPEPLRVRVGQ